MDHLKQAEKTIRESWFSDHKIKRITGEKGFQKIVWGKEGTGMYQVVYVLSGNMLYINGDLGVAAFELTGPATIQELSRYELSYFTGKLVASQRNKYEFCDRKAKKEIQEYIFDWCDVESATQLDEESQKVYYELLSGTQEYGSSEMFNAVVYNIWQNSPNVSWFDSEGASLIAGVGQQLSYSVISYWVGLQMIAELQGESKAS